MSESITRDKVNELLVFLPIFEAPDATFVKRWDTSGLPYPVYTGEVLAFFALAGQPCWSDYDYEPQTAGEMVGDDQTIAQASLSEIRTMLTFCVRGERFADGHWKHMLEEGRIQALLRRLRDIRETIPTS